MVTLSFGLRGRESVSGRGDLEGQVVRERYTCWGDNGWGRESGGRRMLPTPFACAITLSFQIEVSRFGHDLEKEIRNQLPLLAFPGAHGLC